MSGVSGNFYSNENGYNADQLNVGDLQATDLQATSLNVTNLEIDSISAMLSSVANIQLIVGASPYSGSVGVGTAGKGSLFISTTTGDHYRNTGTTTTPVWTTFS